MKKALKWGAIGLVVVFLGIQVIRPARKNPAVDPAKAIGAVVEVPADVQAILSKACMDCHSNETRWPWYSQVAPVSWMVAKHVRQGRKEMNLSEFGGWAPKKQAHKLREACEEVHQGEMPLASYTLVHGDAKLSQAERDRFCAWTEATERAIKAAGKN